MKKMFSSLMVLFLILSFGCANAVAPKDELGPASDCSITDLAGKTLKLSDISASGKVIILNFFGVGCPPCRMEMPDFNILAQKYKDKVEIIAVNVWQEDKATVEQFARQLGLTFSVCLDDSNVSELYGPMRAVPVTVIIDKDFKIVRKYVGSRPKDVFEQDIKELTV